MTELRNVTCHMESHGVTCYPTQVNAPHCNPSQQYLIYLPRRDGGLSWPRLPSNGTAGNPTSDLSNRPTSPTPWPLHLDAPSNQAGSRVKERSQIK